MNFLALLALILLTLVGYSSGTILGAKGRMVVPRIADLLTIIALWAGALTTRSLLGAWAAIGAWLLIGLALGTVMAWTRADDGSDPRVQVDEGGGLWNAWKSFGRKMGNFQSRVLMAYMYFIVVTPFGLGLTCWGDPLKIRRAGGHSNWQPKELPLNNSVDEARRQF